MAAHCVVVLRHREQDRPQKVEPRREVLPTFMRPEAARSINRDIDALKDAGFLTEVWPEQYVKGIADDFREFAKKNLSDPERRAALIPALAKRKDPYSIHPAKIDPELVRVLKDLRLVHLKQNDTYSPIQIDPVAGALYMLFLATEMSSETQLVSDSLLYQSLIFERSADVKPPDKALTPGHDFRLASAVFATAIPGRIEGAEIKTLIKLREKLAEQRLRFRDKIIALAETLQSKDGTPPTEEKLARQARAILDESAAGADVIQSLKLGLGSSLFSLTVPSYITSQCRIRRRCSCSRSSGR